MEVRRFGYIRISSKVQNEGRQMEFMKNLGLDEPQNNYQTKHFWEKDTKYNITADDIMTYYEKSVPSIGNFNIEFNPSDRPVCRVFNDFFIKKKPSLKEFVQQHIFNISRFVLTTITFTYPCWMVDISRQGHIMK